MSDKQTVASVIEPVQEENSLAIKNYSAMQVRPAGIDPMALIARWMETGQDVSILERLMALRDKLRAEEAEQLYLEALAAFQGECPIIEKRKHVQFNRTDYWYAPLDHIIEVAKPILQKHGLSYTFGIDATDKAVSVTLDVQHCAGHKVRYSMIVPVTRGDGTSMNETQHYGSARTYASRYAFCGAFGILTGDSDDDGRSATPLPAEKTAPAMPKRKSASPAHQPTPEEIRRINAQEAHESGAAEQPDFSQPGWIQAKIEERKQSSGTNAKTGKSWTRYGYKINGKMAGTFSASLAGMLDDAQATGYAIWVRLAQNDKYTDIADAWRQS